MGEQTGIERAVGNMTVMPSRPTCRHARHVHAAGDARSGGMHGGHGAMGRDMSRRRVPGYPQGMMDMPMDMPAERLRKLTGKRETRGMRRDWYTGVQGLMTVVRVLPPDLYDAGDVGRGRRPPGASIPAATRAIAAHHHHPR